MFIVIYINTEVYFAYLLKKENIQSSLSFRESIVML